MTLSGAFKRNDLLKAALPYASDARYHAVDLLGRAINKQQRRIHVIPASSILYCTVFIKFYTDTDTK